MRAVLFLAVFALAASAQMVNTTAYQVGFADQLLLNGTRAEDAAKCQKAISAVVATAEKFASAKTPEQYALVAVNLYTQIKVETVNQCAPYAEALIGLASSKSNGTEHLQALVQLNLARYHAQIIQLATYWIDALIAGDFYVAGQKDAQIFQILFGLEIPAALPVNQLNATKIVAFNQSKFIQETYGTYLTKVGMNASDVSTTVQCLNTLSTIEQSFGAALQSLAVLPTVEERLQATKPLYANLIKATIPCIKAAKAYAQFSAPQVQIFANAPAFVILTVLHNVGLNFPQIQQASFNQQVNILQGEYTQAGEGLFSIYNTVYKGIF